MLKKAIITGATGSIGLALIECLIKNNISVTVFLNPQSVRNDEILNNFLINKIFCDINNNFLINEIENKITDKTKIIIFVEQYGFTIQNSMD